MSFCPLFRFLFMFFASSYQIPDHLGRDTQQDHADYQFHLFSVKPVCH